MKKAVIMGVGTLNGLGGALSKKFAQEGMEVFVSGRSKEKLDIVVNQINKLGLKAHSFKADTRDINQIQNLLDFVGEGLNLAIYNVGNNMPGNIVDMDPEYFRECWEQCCYGGFLFSKLVIKKYLSEKIYGKLFFTGASASLRGKENFGAFNSAKGALRNLAQALAKEHGKNSIHIAHIIIDGGLNGDRIKKRLPNYKKLFGENGLIELKEVTEAYKFLYYQKQSGWTFELDLRTNVENW